MEKKLRQSQDRLDLALWAADLAWWDWNVATGEVTASTRKAEMLGYEPGEMGKNVQDWIDIIHPDEYEAAMQSMRDHLEGRTSCYQILYRLKKKDGSYKWCRDRGRICERDPEGKPLRVTGMVQDYDNIRRTEIELEKMNLELEDRVKERTRALEKQIEERKKLEDQIVHAQKTESLGVLAGGVAHDFNNLLMAVLGNVDLLRMDLPADSELLDFANEIETAAKRGAKLSHQMLAYSGQSAIMMDEINCSELLENLAYLIKVSVSPKAQVRFELEPDLPPMQADAAQMRQLLLNLLNNASEALHDSAGSIYIRANTRKVTAEELADGYQGNLLDPGVYACLEIEDTGEGIPPENLPRIFDPFFSTRFTGRGLGLAASFGIIRAHGGAVRITSEKNVGTCVRILFPTIEQTASSKEPSAGAETPEQPARYQGDKPATILVIDDEPSIRKLADSILRRSGYEVLTAASGEEAVDIFKAKHEEIDAVVLDHVMPGLDGKETLDLLRKIESDLPVVLASGYSEAVIHDIFDADRPSAILQKPFTEKDWLSALEKALASSPA